ncbi:hypothetical protein [Cupriavidus taiwanensis]|uniref:Uncharacterized protein n=1 Tax=Cupriavidus taiwanensis TaxID=164546 RepID=A0A975X3S6_9BURK|nr:hypothetical protein CBM2587_A80020 [Cupriavidus taiwanensis]
MTQEKTAMPKNSRTTPRKTPGKIRILGLADPSAVRDCPPAVIEGLISEVKGELLAALGDAFSASILYGSRKPESLAAFDRLATAAIDATFDQISPELRAGIEKRSRRSTRNSRAFTPDMLGEAGAYFYEYCVQCYAKNRKVYRTYAYAYVAEMMGLDSIRGIQKHLKDEPLPDRELIERMMRKRA